MPEIKTYMPRLIQSYQSGQIKTTVDMGEHSKVGPFKGLHSVYDAVEVTGSLFYELACVKGGSGLQEGEEDCILSDTKFIKFSKL